MRELFNIEHLKKAAKLGGQTYKKLYGNPGTLEGRRKGGLTTYKRYKNKQFAGLKLNFKSRKSIKIPLRGNLLAEYIGILLVSKALVNSVFQVFNKLQYNPTRSIDTVVLRKQGQIIRYFNEIGSNNPKHISRFTQYFEQIKNNGEVSEWLKEPVSKTGMV